MIRVRQVKVNIDDNSLENIKKCTSKKLNIKYYISRLIIYFLSCSNLDLPSYILLEVNYVFFKDIHVRIRLFFVVVIILFLVI